jgi:hypothetical protein
MTPRRLRYALMLTRRGCRAWQADCIRALLEVEAATPARIIRAFTKGPGNRPRFSPGGVLWRLLHRVEIRRHLSPAREMHRLPEKAAAIPVIECALERHGAHAYQFAAADLDLIRGLDLDFILALPSREILRGGILDAARYGIWSYHHGDPRRQRGAPPGVWEIYAGEPRSGAILQRLTDRLDAGIVLRQGDFPTIDHSFVLNSDNLFFQSAGWAAEICRKLAAGEPTNVDDPPVAEAAPIRRAPNNRQALRLAFILLRNNVRRAVSRRRA